MNSKAMSKSTSKSISPRHLGTLKKLVVYPAVLAGAYFLFNWYNAIPSCASGAVRESIQLSAWDALRAKNPEVVPRLPTMLKAQEIGHASARRERGCVATVRAGEELLSYAYIVEPREHRRVKFGVTQAHPLLVTARFGHLDRDGDFGNKAQPVGRDNIERALRSVLDSPNMFTTGTLISQVEPMGSCRFLQEGQRYACDVMLELSNPSQTRASAFHILQATFIFERDASQSAWRAAGDTYGKYLHAVHEARKMKPVVKTVPTI